MSRESIYSVDIAKNYLNKISIEDEFSKYGASPPQPQEQQFDQLENIGRLRSYYFDQPDLSGQDALDYQALLNQTILAQDIIYLEDQINSTSRDIQLLLPGMMDCIKSNVGLIGQVKLVKCISNVLNAMDQKDQASSALIKTLKDKLPF